jgi:uncharacterized protein involved in exopolysaccharide biosynthesis
MTTTPRISQKVVSLNLSDRPSVPLSVYRELVKELQVTQARADSLESQNKQLVKSNQQLRQEIETVVAQGKRLERVVQSFEANQGLGEDPSFVIPVRPRLVTPPSRPVRVTEMPTTPPLTVTAPKPQFSKSGWLMVGGIILVILTSGFGAFWLVSVSRR